MTRKALLVAPVFGGGRGGGHLARSAALVRELRALGREAYLYIPALEGPVPAGLLGNTDSAWILGTGEELSCRAWEWIVLDRFRTSAGEFKRWAALAPVIGIDEGGPARENFDFLIDLLPGLPGIHPANLTAPYLLPLPENRREPAFPFQDMGFQDINRETDLPPTEVPGRGRLAGILVSFGAEDPGGLTAPAALALAGKTGGDGITVTALFGVLNRNRAQSQEGLEQAGVRVCGNIPDLGECLADYDLVITHFGVTAFEALRAGVPVVLVSPTRRHEQLARGVGFISAGNGEAAFRKLRGLVYGEGSKNAAPPGSAGKNIRRAFRDISVHCRELAGRYFPDSGAARSLGSLISGFTPLLSPVCPACGHSNRPEDPVLARFPERSYRRCRRCSLVYMERTAPPPIEYGAAYFSDSYRKQYGKTYLEDFPGLKRAGKARLRRIRGILAKTGVARVLPERLLDIGCAFGPFLAAAAEDGFEPAGIDSSAEAVAYVRDRLRIPAVQGFFPDQARRGPGREQGFAAVTLWYVIEHFTGLREALVEIHRLLRPGGVLAWSSPSFSGISARKSRREFLRASPADHWTVWDPRRVSRILGFFGFEVRKTVITGHHPERFPVIGGLFKGRRGPAYRLCFGLSRVLGWGDTFEVYAVKKAVA
ncbi:MAG: methyltransferase domain-containing protein [Spirochaetaceae bacterium]|jgi:2-polyprenyl-3-methyl-5-hydroxy-6-metoxy-1,4-benzoquinol methylase/spore coat polysaccharide biosynthesis predicted glycosyltransferase SpsG|nr:methyltransferase domain-containing protein [Spirochaetaceae bacterium]